VDTSNSRPALVSRTAYCAGDPFSVTLWTCAPAGTVAPTCNVQERPAVTVVV